METITVEFDDTGNPVISVKGIKGKGCKALTKAIEDSLGTTSSDKTTSEYNAIEIKRGLKIGR